MNGSSRVSRTLVLFLVIPALMSGCCPEGPPGRPLPDDGTGQDEYILPCLLCHTAPVGRRRAIVDESGAGGHTLGRAALTNVDCTVCHEMTRHAWGSVRLWESPVRREAVIELTGDPSKDPDEAEQVTELCTACHGAAADAGHQVRGDWQPACITCHDLHDPGSENLTLISRSVYNRTLEIEMPVVFSARRGPGSFDDGDPTVDDGICQVCHTNTSYHMYDGSSTPHFDGMDCITCHPHSTGFTPVGGMSAHHLLYDQPIPPDSMVPHPDSDGDRAPDPTYACLSCHDENFTVVRDCASCHKPP